MPGSLAAVSGRLNTFVRLNGWGINESKCFSDGTGGALSVLCSRCSLRRLPSPRRRSGAWPGTVLDQSGGVLPGATITLTNTGTGQVHDDDRWCRLGVPVSAGAGRHLQGRTSPSKDSRLRRTPTSIVSVGQEYSLTAKLELGAMTEVVTVTAGASLVSTTTPEVTARCCSSRCSTSRSRTATSRT